jgi:PAS domain S-box-containing protein
MPATSDTRYVEAIITLDAEGLINGANADVTAALDYRADELIGRPIEQLVAAIAFEQSNTSAPASIHQRLRAAVGTSRQRVHVLHGNGQTIDLTLTVDEIVLRDGTQLLLKLQTPSPDFVDWIQRDWQRAFNAADRAIAIVSADGKTIELANSAFAAMYGYTADALINKPLSELCAPGTHADFAKQTAQVRRDGRHLFETMQRHRQGHSFPVAIDFAVISNDAGVVAYSIVYVLDISERKRMEEELRLSKEFFQRVYDHAAIAMVICDLDGRYISVNNAMSQLIGYEGAELVARSYSDFVHPQEVGDAAAWKQQITQGGLDTLQFEKRYIHKSGKIIWTLVIVTVVRSESGEPLYAIGQLIDLDSEKQLAQQQRWTYNQRDNLVREVHHRIKNNLQSVTGLLRRQIHANPAAADALRQAINQVEAIAVVHGLESSAGNRRMRICEILCGIIAEANKLQAEVDPIKYPVLLEKPALVRSEEAVPIALILSELLTNAVKHHCPLRALDIRITIARHVPDEVRIVIANPAEALPAGFDFDAGKGIGQGLKLVRAMVPKKDMHVHFEHRNGSVSATITLRPPIIYAEDIAQPNALPHNPMESP